MTERIVGLDIGSKSIKAALVTVAPDSTATVEATYAVDLPRQVVVGGEMKQDVIITDALIELWETNNIPTKNVVFGIDSVRVDTGVVKSEGLAPEQLEAALPSYVRKQRPLDTVTDTDAYILDHVVIDEYADKGLKRLDVLVGAVPKHMVNETALAIMAAGLNVLGGNLTGLATLQAISVPRREHSLAVDLIIDIGADLVTMTLHRSGVPRRVVTSTKNAGRSVTQMVKGELPEGSVDQAGNLVTTDDEREILAEQVKRNVSPGGPFEAAINRVNGKIVKSVIEMMRDYIRTDPDGPGLVGITLTGGGSLITGLTGALHEEFKVHVQYGTVDPRISSPNGQIPHFDDEGRGYLTAIGLATGKRA